MICENCGAIHNGLFASGRFCDRKCCNAFSTKNKRLEINAKVSQKLLKPKTTYECITCGVSFIQKRPNRKFCSRSCSGKHSCQLKINERKLYPEKWGEFQKSLYSSGAKTVNGGTTKWYAYKDIKVQGTYELRTCKILDSWVEIGKIKSWEYTKDRIPYIGFDDKEHTYLLDFKVYENDGSFYYIETKGYTQQIDLLKWQAVKSLGIRLDVWFKSNIEFHEL